MSRLIGLFLVLSGVVAITAEATRANRLEIQPTGDKEWQPGILESEVQLLQRSTTINR